MRHRSLLFSRHLMSVGSVFYTQGIKTHYTLDHSVNGRLLRDTVNIPVEKKMKETTRFAI